MKFCLACLFTFYVASVTYSTAKPNGESTTAHRRGSKRVRIEYDFLQSKRSKDGEIVVPFVDGGRKLQLYLTSANDIRSSSFEKDKNITSLDHYRGFVLGHDNSYVFGSVADNVFQGYLMLGHGDTLLLGDELEEAVDREHNEEITDEPDDHLFNDILNRTTNGSVLERYRRRVFPEPTVIKGHLECDIRLIVTHAAYVTFSKVFDGQWGRPLEISITSRLAEMVDFTNQAINPALATRHKGLAWSMGEVHFYTPADCIDVGNGIYKNRPNSEYNLCDATDPFTTVMNAARAPALAKQSACLTAVIGFFPGKERGFGSAFVADGSGGFCASRIMKMYSLPGVGLTSVSAVDNVFCISISGRGPHGYEATAESLNRLFTHELGHTFGAPHSDRCPQYDSGPTRDKVIMFRISGRFTFSGHNLMRMGECASDAITKSLDLTLSGHRRNCFKRPSAANSGSYSVRSVHRIKCGPCLQGRCLSGTCICDPGWTGLDCSAPICDPRCHNRGSCVSPGICTCQTGYTGAYCQISLFCSIQCQNGGHCVEPNRCSCPAGYSGSHCQKPVCSFSCNMGVCSAPETCTCYQGYRGIACDLPHGPPKCSQICLNGGACIRRDHCQCLPGYIGSDCGVSVCKPKCQNGGVCVAPDVCRCTDPYTGFRCETAVGPPYRSEAVKVYCRAPCLNGGVCVGHNKCECQAGWRGHQCRFAICTKRCVNGECSAPNTCTCFSGWRGFRCDRPASV